MKCSFFQSVVDTAVWMHYMDAHEMYGENVWRKLHKNVASNIGQVLEAAPHKAAGVRPLTTHPENYSS